MVIFWIAIIALVLLQISAGNPSGAVGRLADGGPMIIPGPGWSGGGGGWIGGGGGGGGFSGGGGSFGGGGSSGSW